MIDLLDEIKQDFEKQRLINLWDRLGRWVIIAVISIIAGTALVVWFNQYQTQQNKHLGSQFYTLLHNSEKASNNDEKQKIAAQLKVLSESNSPYAPLAKLHYAQYLFDNNQPQEAKNSLSALAQNTGKNNIQVIHELINTLAIRHKASSEELNEKSYQQLNYLARQDGPWKPLAQEQLLLHAITQTDWSKAHDISKAITSNPKTPYSIKQRVMELRTSLPPLETAASTPDNDT